MDADFINLTAENLADEHLCCIIRSKSPIWALEYCLADAKENGKSGVCMLGAQKQKHWLSDREAEC